MKITKIQSWLIAVPYDHGAPKRPLATGSGRTTQDAVYVRVETDTGLVGWGEAFGFGTCTMSQLAIERVVAPLAIGMEADDIDALMIDLWKRTQNMSRNGPVAYALSGLEIALWDLKGKALGKPLHELLGGAKRTSIPAYASLLRLNTPEQVAMGCTRALERGYRHVKLHERTIEAVAAARYTLGPHVQIMLDTNCTWTPDEASHMVDELEGFGLAWLEEPIFPPDDYNALKSLRGRGIPIAAGENIGNIMDVRHMLQIGAVDILQPDVAKMGGIGAMMEAMHLCEAADVEFHPHSPLFGPALVATLHICAVMEHETACEFYFADVEANPIGTVALPQDGAFNLPQGPGLGITVDEDVIARYRIA